MHLYTAASIMDAKTKLEVAELDSIHEMNRASDRSSAAEMGSLWTGDARCVMVRGGEELALPAVR